VRLMTEGRLLEICSGTELPSEWRRLRFHNITIAAASEKMDSKDYSFCNLLKLFEVSSYFSNLSVGWEWHRILSMTVQTPHC